MTLAECMFSVSPVKQQFVQCVTHKRETWLSSLRCLLFYAFGVRAEWIINKGVCIIEASGCVRLCWLKRMSDEESDMHAPVNE